MERRFLRGIRNFTRLKEDVNTLVIYCNEHDKWMRQNPKAFFITRHYKNYPMMLIDLASVRKKNRMCGWWFPAKYRSPEIADE